MTVRELVEKLLTFNQDYPIQIQELDHDYNEFKISSIDSVTPGPYIEILLEKI
jgi:hypothetical protein